MTVKWASFVFWNVLNPAFYAHHVMRRQKVLIDRMLEKRSPLFNFTLGAVFGTAAFFIAAPIILPGRVHRSTSELQADITEILGQLKLDTRTELPTTQLVRARDMIVAKVYVTNDKAEVRRQREEMARLKEELQQQQKRIQAKTPQP